MGASCEGLLRHYITQPQLGYKGGHPEVLESAGGVGRAQPLRNDHKDFGETALRYDGCVSW
jgi:hypothetical protein